eukprot:TRINITY_DN18789_c0_g1_i1.p1 TRINITY_DN18789_c0_g1~~TRINITY_DN18789_c0_g1_i1.p1  ORF type:complete len:209 (+),score=48.68 TRINITY_DN18789_c0_g1_i1:123-749(+)
MVKKVSAREKVQAKLAKQKAAAENKVAAGDGQQAQSGSGGKKAKAGFAVGQSGRVTRKIAKQARFAQKLQTSHQALAPTKTIAKKRKKRRGAKSSGHTLESLESLAKFLPTAESLAMKASSSQRGSKIMRSKARQEITKEETKQLAAVLSHPAYQQNPFAAIRQHLQNTLPPRPAPLPAPSDKKQKGKKKRTKKSAANADGLQTMDIS